MTPGFITSIEEANEFGHPHHPTLAQCHAKILKDGGDPSTYKSFSFIRNPWSHMHSMWSYAKKTDGTNKSFEEYVWSHFEGWRGGDSWDVSHQFSGYLPRLVSKFGNVDYVGTFEDFDYHIETLIGFILGKHIKSYVRDIQQDWLTQMSMDEKKVALLGAGLGYEIASGPKHLNKSSKDKLEYLEAYTNQSKQIVEKLYSADIKKFGYYFDGRKENENAT
tara:strand:- start:245 stop:904 length:660 start_codon:yes stop_codon:yes gene_type:complete